MVEDWSELVGDESGSRALYKTALVLADDSDAMDCRRLVADGRQQLRPAVESSFAQIQANPIGHSKPR
jgi:hypothetical protein